MPDARHSMLLVRAGAHLCAFPLADVRETMPALPVKPLSGTPSFVRGAALIRGAVTPVVDLRALLGEPLSATPGRFIALRIGDRTAALAVDEVRGVESLREAGMTGMPPLLRPAASEAVREMGNLDGS